MNDSDTWDDEYAEHDAIPSSDRESISLPLQAAEAWIDYDEIETVIEVGCGNGRHTTYFTDNGVEVQAIDFSGEALDRARERVKASDAADQVTFHEQDVLDGIPLPDASADLVVDAYTSCHFLEDDDLAVYMQEVGRVLRSGGSLYWSGLGAEDGYYGKLDETHPDDQVIVDPLNDVAKRLYTQDEVVEDLPGAPEAEYSMEMTFDDFVRNQVFERHVLAALYRFDK